MSLVDDTVALEGFAPERAQAACTATRAELQTFARELVSSLRFYQSQPSSLGISELVLSGGTVALPGLAAELERLTGVVVRVGDPMGRVALGKRVVDESPSLAIAIGLGIED
jgi:Tfp pilus assembly PilM family ATPase